MAAVELVVPVGDKGQVELALPQVVGLGAVLQPGQLQLKAGLPVSQVHQPEGAVLRLLGAYRGELQSFMVEGQGPVQVQNVEVKVSKAQHMIHLINGMRDKWVPKDNAEHYIT